MIRRSAVSLLFACIIWVARAAPSSLTPEQFLSYPFPDEVIASPVGATVAWIFNERGVRNLYAADAPDFKARRVTAYTDDDGQELTNLTFKNFIRAAVSVVDDPTAQPTVAKLTNPVLNGVNADSRPPWFGGINTLIARQVSQAMLFDWSPSNQWYALFCVS